MKVIDPSSEPMTLSELPSAGKILITISPRSDSDGFVIVGAWTSQDVSHVGSF